LINQHVVLISSGQPALNPRLVKEADTLAKAGYQVTVIYQYWNNWATELDQQILPSKTWKAIRVGGSPTENKFLYWLSRVRQKTAKILVKQFGFRFKFAEKAIGRCTFLLLKEALRHPADLYIAHNLAALPVAVKAAKKQQVKCGFDAEDFHRNETADEPKNLDVRLKAFLEEKYIPRVDYITASSLEIAKQYQTIFHEKNITTILNAFLIEKEVRFPSLKEDGTLKLFWFSQTIGLNRGLQDILSAIKILEDHNIELHLLGNLSDKTSIELKAFVKSLNFSNQPKITFHLPAHPDTLAVFAAQFDIGLALEPGFCLNNKLALSNKIFTYLQAGLAIVASDTEAQTAFLEQYSLIGKSYQKNNVQQLANILLNYINQPEFLLTTKQEAYDAARNKLNWETESRKFLKVIRETLEG
jgi:glycosyltransferase involved in cell wall biosynthesis